jgi:hypothetical protein
MMMVVVMMIMMMKRRRLMRMMMMMMRLRIRVRMMIVVMMMRLLTEDVIVEVLRGDDAAEGEPLHRHAALTLHAPNLRIHLHHRHGRMLRWSTSC